MTKTHLKPTRINDPANIPASQGYLFVSRRISRFEEYTTYRFMKVSHIRWCILEELVRDPLETETHAKCDGNGHDNGQVSHDGQFD